MRDFCQSAMHRDVQEEKYLVKNYLSFSLPLSLYFAKNKLQLCNMLYTQHFLT